MMYRQFINCRIITQLTIVAIKWIYAILKLGTTTSFSFQDARRAALTNEHLHLELKYNVQLVTTCSGCRICFDNFTECQHAKA